MINKINNALLSLQQSTYTDWLKSFLLVSFTLGMLLTLIIWTFIFMHASELPISTSHFFIILAGWIILSLIASICISLIGALQAVIFFRYIPRLSTLVILVQLIFFAVISAMVLIQEYGMTTIHAAIDIFIIFLIAQIIIILLAIKNMNKRLALQSKI